MSLILLVFAFVIAAIAAFFTSLEPHRLRLVAAALAFWFLALIVGSDKVAGWFH